MSALAPATVTPAAFARVLGPERAPLVLAPASARGWFGGRTLVAWDPVSVAAGVTLADAASALEAAYAADEPQLVAVLARYDGTCAVARYAGALTLAEDGWRAWGDVPADAADVAARARALQVAAVPLAQDAPLLAEPAWDLEGAAYRGAVEALRQRIEAGDVFVANLTARLRGELGTPGPGDAFAALAHRAQADLAAYWAGLPGPTPWVASVSPERFVRVFGGDAGTRLVETCPIKGTRPRGTTPSADADLAQALLADEKERAEHVMVVDLERNDLGVSCASGTVHVDPLYEVIATPYCHQLVSVVRGTLAEGATFADLLAGAFPCGSVTGAPKRAAMRIIAELEASARGAYCGALLAAVPGELDSSVLIRTLEGLAEDPRAAVWGAGGGITHDSDPAAEHLEALLKASPVLGDGAPAVPLRETMRVAYGRAPLLDRHLARLASGGAGPGVLARVRDAVAEQLAALDPEQPYARLGITVTPDGAVSAGMTHEPSSLAVVGGPRLVPVEIASPPQLPLGAAKPASRRYWDRAHHAAQLAGGDQAVLHTPEGVLVDGSTANVWLVLGGKLVTPPAPPAVAGVARGLVFDLAAQAGIPAHERAVTLADLDAADEVLLSNAVGGIVAIRDRGGAVSQVLADGWARVFTSV